MSDDYEELLDKLRHFVKSKGRVSFEELTDWSASVGVSTITLYLLVEDLLKDSNFTASEERVLVDKDIDISIPTYISYNIREENTAKSEKVEHKTVQLLATRASRPDRTRSRQKTHKVAKKRVKREKGSILTFLSSPLSEETEEKPEERIPKTKEEEPKEPVEDEVAEEKTEEKKEEPAYAVYEEDEDLVKALRYLSRYWSVGEIRFAEDLAKMGVKDPSRVLSELVAKGYAIRTKLGVINATDKVPREKQSDVLLSELI